MSAALESERALSARLAAENATLHAQLAEAIKLTQLQGADLERFKKAYEAAQPNHPERVPREHLQLAFERVLETLTEPANDAAANGATGEPDEAKSPPPDRAPPRKRHGRRRIDLANLPVERMQVDPPEVVAAGGDGYEHIGNEVSYRVARRPGGLVRLELVRRKFARVQASPVDAPSTATEGSDATESTEMPRTPPTKTEDAEPAAVLIAPLPESLWPNVMADPSAIADVILRKYADSLPLHRQETISERQGFVLPRSTQSGWLKAAYPMCEPIVSAMFDEAKRTAFCIATDSTSVSVRARPKCDSWHVLVFAADRDHVVFRYSQRNTSETVSSMLAGFHGHLLADAATVYDALFRSGDVIEVACWMHQRRYVYRALETNREAALEGLSIIAKLFEADRDCRKPGLDPEAFGVARAERARTPLDLFDRWAHRYRGVADPRGPLAKSIGYYDNQRDALRRFLDDGRLSIDNGVSERALRNVVLGEANWTFFANETGLRWYTTFRSLIASAILHRLNCELYMEEMLRLVPHWPKPRVIELAPKYWAQTRTRLDARQRAIITPPWQSAPAPEAAVLLPPRAPTAPADPVPVAKEPAA
jgi:transposase